MKKKNYFPHIIGIIVIAGIGFLWYAPNAVPGKYDAFAQCITDKGAKMYGAYWCPHCKEQKAELGRSFKKIAYIECASGRGQTATCQKAGIKNYPTWEFADKSREEGKLSLEAIAEKTGCELPKDEPQE